MDPIILAIDAGTTGNRVIAFNRDRAAVADAYYEFPLYHPEPGWVEQDPRELWATTHRALTDVLTRIDPTAVAAIGITNQRETVVAWDRRTGEPLHNAIVWQCRRTAPMCADLRAAGVEPLIRERTGLLLDPYFSGTKMRWLLDHVEPVAAAAATGDLCFGTVDSWLLWQLSGGRTHATDASNASRTLLYNLRTGDWDVELLARIGVPRGTLPVIADSAGTFTVTDPDAAGVSVPVTGVLGDQQAALFGQGGWQHGVLKNTYGTGLFLMAATGSEIAVSDDLLSTVGWQFGGERTYALEGSVFIGGACIQWLRDGLGLIADAAESGPLAASLAGNDDVYLVPALSGLGCPYWDPQARGMLIGMTRGTGRAQVVRAALEALAYQTRDVVDAMAAALPELSIDCVRVDGGAARNDFLMQFQADLLGAAIERPVVLESTAAGAAGVAGIAAGVWDRDGVLAARTVDRVFAPALAAGGREALYARWQQAVARCRGWAAV
jgi:glycerol kinase